MAITFPLAIQGFAVLLQPYVSEFRFFLDRFQEVSGTSTHTLVAEMAPARWRAVVQLRPMLQTEAADIQALIEVIEGAGSSGTFEMYDLRKAGAKLDRNGGVVNGAGDDQIVHSVGAKALRVQLLPGHYVLSRGDLISVKYRTSKRALYRVLETVSANASGLTPAFDVEPGVKLGTAPGNQVQIYRARANMMIQPGSFSVGPTAGRFVTGMSFTAIEVP